MVVERNVTISDKDQEVQASTPLLGKIGFGKKGVWTVRIAGGLLGEVVELLKF